MYTLHLNFTKTNYIDHLFQPFLHEQTWFAQEYWSLAMHYPPIRYFHQENI